MLSETLEDAADDEDVIEDCQAHEEPVKDAGHLTAQENGDRNCVTDKTQTAKGYLISGGECGKYFLHLQGNREAYLYISMMCPFRKIMQHKSKKKKCISCMYYFISQKKCALKTSFNSFQ